MEPTPFVAVVVSFFLLLNAGLFERFVHGVDGHQILITPAQSLNIFFPFMTIPILTAWISLILIEKELIVAEHVAVLVIVHRLSTNILFHW